MPTLMVCRAQEAGDEAAGILVRFPAERLRVRTLPLPLVIARTNCATDEQDQQQQQRCRMTPVISTIATVARVGSSWMGELSGVFEKAAVRANSQCPKRPIDPQQIDRWIDRDRSIDGHVPRHVPPTRKLMQSVHLGVTLSFGRRCRGAHTPLI